MLKASTLNFGASDRHIADEINKIRAEHEKEKTELENKSVSALNNATLQVKIDGENEKRLLKQQLEQYEQQFANMEKMIQEEKLKTKSMSKPRSGSQPLPTEENEDTFHSVDEDQNDSDDEDTYWSGWTWEGDDETGEWVQNEETPAEQGPLYSDLNDEERFQYARQSEAQIMTFDPWPQPGKVMSGCISNHEKIAAGSIIP